MSLLKDKGGLKIQYITVHHITLLKHIGRDFTQEAKLLLVNGYLMSQVLYLLPLWAGRSEKYLQKLQVIMNNSARFVTCNSKRSKTLDLMSACRWLTIKELGLYHSMVTTWKLVRWKTPSNLATKLHMDHNSVISTTIPSIQNTQLSFRWRSVTSWNTLPTEIRSCPSLPRFKRMIRSWILSNRPNNDIMAWFEDEPLDDTLEHPPPDDFPVDNIPVDTLELPPPEDFTVDNTSSPR